MAAEFPKKLEFLFRPMRFKVAKGGRGGSKSWGYARALLILGAKKKHRILCAREVQNSIKDSVHKLLKDQIKLLGLEGFYTVTDTAIKGKNGTEFAFTGLSVHTVESIKSFEGCTICWIEEGQTISKRSLDILIPTIRENDSEIWISYNPDLRTDEVHQRFAINTPDDCICVHIGWQDNPWFNDVLNKERLRCKEQQPDDYDNIWEGKCRPAAEGAVFHKEVSDAEDAKRICNVPYDPMLKVHVVLDLGWADSLCAGLVQRHLSEIRIIESIEASKTKLDVFSSELRLRPYNWGRVWPPHDGFTGNLNSGGKSTYDILRALGWDVAKIDEISQVGKEDGIRLVRMMFNRLYFDKAKCDAEKAPNGGTRGFYATDLNNRVVESLRRYKRKVSTDGTEGGTVRDEYAHGADMIRYVCVNADLMVEEERFEIIPGYGAYDSAVGL